MPQCKATACSLYNALLARDKLGLRPVAHHSSSRTCVRRSNTQITFSMTVVRPAFGASRTSSYTRALVLASMRILYDAVGLVAGRPVALQITHFTKIFCFVLSLSAFCIQNHGTMLIVMPQECCCQQSCHHPLYHVFAQATSGKLCFV